MTVSTIVFLVGRGLVAALFILAGITKIIGPKPVVAHMKEQHVPGFLLPVVALFEIAAAALAAFCLATAVVFHRNFADRAERTQFVKDIALAGGLAVLATVAAA